MQEELFVENVTKERKLLELVNTFVINVMPSSRKLISSSGEIPSIHTTLTAADAEWNLRKMPGRLVEIFIVSVVTTLWESLYVVPVIGLLKKELSMLLENNGTWSTLSVPFVRSRSSEIGIMSGKV